MASNIRYFSFADRYLPLKFFEDEPITITLTICRDTDKKFDDLLSGLKTATTYEAKYKLLCGLIGKDKADELLARADDADDYAISQLLLFIHRSYTESRTKNLSAAASGKMK